MLLGSFYHIIQTTPTEGGFYAKVKLNPAHPIFEGHFPGNPVVPGVCQIQIVEEMLGEVTGTKKELKNSGYIKFLHTINPVTSDVLEMEVTLTEKENSTTEVNASYQWDNRTVFKFKGFFE